MPRVPLPRTLPATTASAVAVLAGGPPGAPTAIRSVMPRVADRVERPPERPVAPAVRPRIVIPALRSSFTPEFVTQTSPRLSLVAPVGRSNVFEWRTTRESSVPTRWRHPRIRLSVRPISRKPRCDSHPATLADLRQRRLSLRTSPHAKFITSVKMSACPNGRPAEFRASVHTGYSSEPPTAIPL